VHWLLKIGWIWFENETSGTVSRIEIIISRLSAIGMLLSATMVFVLPVSIPEIVRIDEASDTAAVAALGGLLIE
jgi:hypothetical protein